LTVKSGAIPSFVVTRLEQDASDTQINQAEPSYHPKEEKNVREPFRISQAFGNPILKEYQNRE